MLTYKRAEGEAADKGRDDKDCKPRDPAQMLEVVEKDDVQADTVGNRNEQVIRKLLQLHCAYYSQLDALSCTWRVFPRDDDHALIVPESMFRSVCLII